MKYKVHIFTLKYRTKYIKYYVNKYNYVVCTILIYVHVNTIHKIYMYMVVCHKTCTLSISHII